METRDMACHTWALSGNPIAAAGVNSTYVSLMDEIGAQYGYGENLGDRTLGDIRQETMDKIQLISEARTQQTDHEVYLCGGFREGQVCPEHLWIEDHTDGRTFDTFINQDVIRVDRVGVVGQPFQPGCEADAFNGDQIFRVRLDGYTQGQVASLPAAV